MSALMFIIVRQLDKDQKHAYQAITNILINICSLFYFQCYTHHRNEGEKIILLITYNIGREFFCRRVANSYRSGCKLSTTHATAYHALTHSDERRNIHFILFVKQWNSSCSASDSWCIQWYRISKCAWFNSHTHDLNKKNMSLKLKCNFA